MNKEELKHIQTLWIKATASVISAVTLGDKEREYYYSGQAHALSSIITHYRDSE